MKLRVSYILRKKVLECRNKIKFCVVRVNWGGFRQTIRSGPPSFKNCHSPKVQEAVPRAVLTTGIEPTNIHIYINIHMLVKKGATDSTSRESIRLKSAANRLLESL